MASDESKRLESHVFASALVSHVLEYCDIDWTPAILKENKHIAECFEPLIGDAVLSIPVFKARFLKVSDSILPSILTNHKNYPLFMYYVADNIIKEDIPADFLIFCAFVIHIAVRLYEMAKAMNEEDIMQFFPVCARIIDVTLRLLVVPKCEEYLYEVLEVVAEDFVSKLYK